VVAIQERSEELRFHKLAQKMTLSNPAMKKVSAIASHCGRTVHYLEVAIGHGTNVAS
jgi:hypothetical protein